MTEDVEHLRQWIGRAESLEETLHDSPLAGLSAALDRDGVLPDLEAELPPTAHWLFFLPRAPQSQIGPDGHPLRGGFMPPVELPRRMWAGSRIKYHQPLRVGQRVRKTSTVTDVSMKEGTAGQLVFVVVRHEYQGPNGLALVEEQDLVYRDDPTPGAPAPAQKPAPAEAAWRRTIDPDPVLLFRYSALTFNSHRIHYDLPYAKEVEGYPGLIVHGPLTATLMLDLFLSECPEARITGYRYRAMSPLICGNAFDVAGALSEDGNSAELWAQNGAGGLAMKGTVTWD